MVIKKVFPITLKSKEYSVWNQSNYAAKAVISEDVTLVKKILEISLKDFLTNGHYAVCMGLGLTTTIIEKLRAQFNDITQCSIHPPKGNMLVKPGAVIFLTNSITEILKLVAYWGTLDGIQIIIPFIEQQNNVLSVVDNKQYTYNRHDFDTWHKLMTYSLAVITDTSTGKEFEFVYRKDNVSQIGAIVRYAENLKK